jgi:hypothetical protein
VGDWYTVIKTIKGYRYLYRQRTWRDGTRVRTESQYIGPAGSGTASAATSKTPLSTSPLDSVQAVALWERGEITELRASELIPKFRAALRKYSGVYGSDRVNKALRGDIALNSGIKNEILCLKGALEHPKAILKETIALYRGAVVRSDKLSLGSEFDDHGFLSFSLERNRALPFLEKAQPNKWEEKVFYKLIAYKGEAGYVQLTEVSDFSFEREVLCRGSRFKIVEIIEEEGTKTCVVERIRKAV